MAYNQQTYVFATWNIAGITSPSNLQLLKDIIIQNNLDIICLQECNFYHFSMFNYTFLVNGNSLTSKNVAMLVLMIY